MITRRAVVSSGLGLAGATLAHGARAKNMPGVTATEIKIGQTMPYSGPASNYGTIGRAEQAYFAMINAQGGINGRRINLISRDDGYSPPKTVEQIRQMVESDRVAFIFQSLGDVTNAAIRRYLNDRKIPQLFVADGTSRWNDPRQFPWTMGWQPSYRTEAHIDAKLILDQKPDGRIGILVQDSLGGHDYLTGFREGLGDKADKMIVKTLTYQATDATVDSQIESLHASGANVFLNYSIPKFAAQAIRRIHGLDWKPMQVMTSVSVSIAATLEPAGLENSIGILSVFYVKDASDPRWDDDPGMIAWRKWMTRWYPEGNPADPANVYAYLVAQTLEHVLRQCGNDLSRENVMRQAANLHDLTLPLLLPGITINTSPSDYRPVRQMQPVRFNGRNWDLFGKLITG